MNKLAYPVRTSLEVGFSGGSLPVCLQHYRGSAARAIPCVDAFPFEDAQFEVVMLSAAAVNRACVREAHRVLKPAGRLYFIVPEKNAKQEGFTLPDIYAIVRDGYDIVGLERPAWWNFLRRGRTISICAQKKRWKDYRGFVRGISTALSPFHGGT